MDRKSLLESFLLSALLLLNYQLIKWAFLPSTTEAQDMTEQVIDVLGSLKEAVVHVPASEELLTLANEELELTFDSRTGTLSQAHLKHHQHYDGAPLMLFDTAGHGMDVVLTTAEGKTYTTSSLPCRVMQGSDSQGMTFVYALEEGNTRAIEVAYYLPTTGHQLHYAITLQGLEGEGATLQVRWYADLPCLEQRFDTSLQQSNIIYQLTDEKAVSLPLQKVADMATAEALYDHEELPTLTPWQRLKGLWSGGSSAMPVAVPGKRLMWVALKRRFFVAALIPETPPTHLQLLNTPAEEDNNAHLSHTAMLITTPAGGHPTQHSFRLYLGPNNYHCLKGVAPYLERNLYLGPPGIRQCNRYVFVPLADYLHDHVGSPLYALLLLLLLLKLLLLPLTYRNYRNELRKKGLQPLVDALVKRYPKDSEEVELHKMQLYNAHGVGISLTTILSSLSQLPIFFSMVYLIRNTMLLRNVPLLWMQDLSSYDALLRLPFKLPFLGDHLSPITLLAVAVLFLPRLLQQRQAQTSTQGQGMLTYLFPIVFFVAFNSAPAGWCLYQATTGLIDMLANALFKHFTDEEEVKTAALTAARQKPQQPKGGATRTQARLQKRRQKPVQ